MGLSFLEFWHWVLAFRSRRIAFIRREKEGETDPSGWKPKGRRHRVPIAGRVLPLVPP